jgi:hypothetical protein
LTGPCGELFVAFVIYLIKHHHYEGVTKLVVSHNVRGHDKDINTLAVSPNDSMAASGSQVSIYEDNLNVNLLNEKNIYIYICVYVFVFT